jgi:phage gpG-like protein
VKTVRVKITTDAAKVVAKLDAFPRKMALEIAAAMDKENQLTVGHIVATKLTSAGPQFLNRRTGRLGGSARASEAVVTGNNVSSAIGTNVRYGAVHEFGFRGTVAVKAHRRKDPAGDRYKRSGTRRSIRMKSASGVAFVRAHSRHVNFPARKMFETGVGERVEAYSTAVSAAILRAWQQ